MAGAKKLTLENLGGGELSALAERELTKICGNIADPAVRAEAKRELTIKITVKPDKKRQTAEISYSVKSSLPGPDSSKTTAFIAMAPGDKDVALFGMDIRQQEMFSEGKEPLVSEIRPTGQPKVAEAAPAATYAPGPLQS